MNGFDKDQEKRAGHLFNEAEKMPLNPPPFMKTRILSEIRLAEERRWGRKWKWLAIASPVAVAIVFLVAIFLWEPSFKAAVNQNVLVKIEVNELEELSIAFAEVELPDGVNFYSRKYPDLMDKRNLTLTWEKSAQRRHIPIVIQAKKSGRKSIKVRFLDENHMVISERSIKIAFENSV